MMTLAEINAMTRDQFVATLGWIFEDSDYHFNSIPKTRIARSQAA
jgi:2-oxo-4-hydroxy-4-carboxy--5-ureidoimidazoline (OHCU) decarboxylase